MIEIRVWMNAWSIYLRFVEICVARCVTHVSRYKRAYACTFRTWLSSCLCAQVCVHPGFIFLSYHAVKLGHSPSRLQFAILSARTGRLLVAQSSLGGRGCPRDGPSSGGGGPGRHAGRCTGLCFSETGGRGAAS